MFYPNLILIYVSVYKRAVNKIGLENESVQKVLVCLDAVSGIFLVLGRGMLRLVCLCYIHTEQNRAAVGRGM